MVNSKQLFFLYVWENNTFPYANSVDGLNQIQAFYAVCIKKCIVFPDKKKKKVMSIVFSGSSFKDERSRYNL